MGLSKTSILWKVSHVILAYTELVFHIFYQKMVSQ